MLNMLNNMLHFHSEVMLQSQSIVMNKSLYQIISKCLSSEE